MIDRNDSALYAAVLVHKATMDETGDALEAMRRALNCWEAARPEGATRVDGMRGGWGGQGGGGGGGRGGAPGQPGEPGR